MKNPYANVWNELHKKFSNNISLKYDDWLEEFEEIISKIETPIIDLGCGVTGNNTLWLVEKGKKVISCDFSKEALNVVKKIKGSKTLLFDMLDEFPFEDNWADLVIADLSLHYFSEKDTKRIIKPNGYLFFRLNSVNSTEYKEIIEKGEKELEPNFFILKIWKKDFSLKMI